MEGADGDNYDDDACDGNRPGLIPVIEDTSLMTAKMSKLESDRVSQNSEEFKTPLKANSKDAKHRLRLSADGHTFVRDCRRQDGTTLWRCRKNYDRCSATAYQYSDGQVDVYGTHDHQDRARQNRLISPMGTFAYKFAPTPKGHNVLIFGGCRYSKLYARADGTTLWRCNHAPMCKMKVSLEGDGKVYVTTLDGHTHEKTEPPVTPEDVARNRWNSEKKGISAVDSNKSVREEDLGEALPEEAARSPYKARNCVPPFSTVGKFVPKSIPLKKKKLNFRIVKNKKGFQALVHNGYRYCKARVLQDGTVKWLCKMNRKTCNAGVYQYRDGTIKWLNSVRHNHGPSHWYYVRNKKNGTTLIHAGYRYNKKGVRSDKSSLWRCSRSQFGCRAAIVMYPNETIEKFEDDVDHNHAPRGPHASDQAIDGTELDTSVETATHSTGSEEGASNDVTLAEQQSSAIHSGGFLKELDDPEANMRSLLNLTLDVSQDAQYGIAEHETILSRAEAGYRYVQNRHLKRSLLFRGYRYCKHYQRADRSIQWMCMRNIKTCKATVRTLADGRLVLLNTKHNHSRLEEDENDGEFQEEEEEKPNMENIAENNNTTEDDQQDGSGVSTPEMLDDKRCVTNDSDRNIQDQRETPYDYYYAINRSNRECLIFQECRYCRANTRTDGSVMWKCLMSGGTCPASAIVTADGRCQPFRDYEHNHPPLSELPPAVRYPDVVTQSSSPSKVNASPKAVVRDNKLSYKQHTFKKTQVRPDGIARFECVDAKHCSAIVKIKLPPKDGNTKVLYETPHNHVAVGQPAAAGTLPTTSFPARRNSFPGYDGTFQLYKTQRGQLTLIHENFRYSLRSRVADGTTLWKCRSNKQCGAKFRISKTGAVFQEDLATLKHNHQENGRTMDWAEPIRVNDGDGISSFDELVQQCFPKLPISGPLLSIKRKHPLQPNKTIKYAGHLYTLRTVKPGGRECWRCTMFASKACRAALFCRNNGKIVEHNNGMVHTHKPIAYSRGTATTSIPKLNSPSTSSTSTAVVPYRPPAIPTDLAVDDYPPGIPDEDGNTDYEFGGRTGKTLFHRGYRYCWNYQNRNGITFFKCVRSHPDLCNVTIKMFEGQNRIYPHTGTAHSHPPGSSSASPPQDELVSSPQTKKLSPAKSPAKSPVKSPAKPHAKKHWNINLMEDAGPGLDDYRFERTARGASLWHQGYQFWLHNKLACGLHVYRCRMQKLKCWAAGYFDPKTELFHLRQGVPHNHDVQEAQEVDVDSEQKPLVQERKPPVELLVPKVDPKTKLDESGLETNDYRFVRARKDGKMLLHYRDSVYNFMGKKESWDGEMCNQYHCSHPDCLAALELLPSGLVRVLFAEHKRHPAADLEYLGLENIGRGSTDYEMLTTSTGAQALAFRGYRYYGNNLNRTREDGSSRWYCQSTVSNEKVDKRTIRKRCFIPLIMLPNGCVTSTGIHQHPQYRATEDQPQPSSTLKVDGNRFVFKNRRANDSMVFACAEDPSCPALVVRQADGKVQSTTTPHSHSGGTGKRNETTPPGTSQIKILNGTTLPAEASGSLRLRIFKGTTTVIPKTPPPQSPQPKSSGSSNEAPAADPLRLRILNGSIAAPTPTKKPLIPPPIPPPPARIVGSIPPVSTLPSISVEEFERTYCRRSFWYGGNRYYFFQTRSDGVQHWRCSARTNECKCRAGLIRMTGGMIGPYNNEPHAHPDQSPGKTDPAIPVQPGPKVSIQICRTNVPGEMRNTITPKRDAESGGELQKKKQEEVEQKVPDTGGKKYFKHKGLVYNFIKMEKDGGRIYSCPNKACEYRMLLSPTGRLFATLAGKHLCEEIIAKANDSKQMAPPAATTSSSSSERKIQEPSASVVPLGGSVDCKIPAKREMIDDPPMDNLLTNDKGLRDENSESLMPEPKRIRLVMPVPPPPPPPSSPPPPPPPPPPPEEPLEEERVEQNADTPAADVSHDGDDGKEATMEETDPSITEWLDVEQEEIVDTTNDDTGEDDHNDRSSFGDHSPVTEIDKTQDEATVEATGEETTHEEPMVSNVQAETSIIASTTEQQQDGDESHSTTPIDTNNADESNDELESVSQGSTKELVVSAEPHESYARKESEKNVQADGGTPSSSNQGQDVDV
ncbi:AGAP004541-PA-like protein [Anopheles sinensis]|uniref:AGAP004541-PA-like protein n=1 Tax=Anopheles sinensis TaxID=74873 RepID=A0A084WTV9_ANOSI|nr:AGAP004541-PA-like protein [Anopheles sinensis]